MTHLQALILKLIEQAQLKETEAYNRYMNYKREKLIALRKLKEAGNLTEGGGNK
jgi:hypothetical protein